MGYCVVSEVQDEFKSLDVTVSTSITSARIQRFIDEATAEIDAKLGQKYTTPIVGANALLIVKTICTRMVAGRLMPIIKTKTGGEGSQGVKTEGVFNLEKWARDQLDRIVQGKLPLPDQDLFSPTDGLGSYNSSVGEEFTFQRDRRQW